MAYQPEYDFKLKKYNDGKEKWQSYEFSIEEKRSGLYIIEYGADEDEAQEAILNELDRYIVELLKFRKSIDEKRPLSLNEIFNILDIKPEEKNERVYNCKDYKIDMDLNTFKGESDHPVDK